MTDQQIGDIRKFVWERIRIWLMNGALFGVTLVLLAMFTPMWAQVVAVWRTPEQLAAVAQSLEALKADVNRATGENRVIRQEPGLSYVSEPVLAGQPVMLNLVVSRTALGQSCRLIRGQSLFADEGGVILAGSAIDPMRQINQTPTRLQLSLTPPISLKPGRIELYLGLEYLCGAQVVFDRTDTVAYRLLPAD